MHPTDTQIDSRRPQGVGAPVKRREDARLLDGEGVFLADLRIPGTLEVAMLRSPIAHGRIRGLNVPDEFRGAVFQLSDLPPVKPIQAVNKAPGFQASDYPALAQGKVRFVGEPIALCVAATRAAAEDIVQACEVDFEELPGLPSIAAALAPGAPLVHEHWRDNLSVETNIRTGEIDTLRDRAPVVVRKRARVARHAAVPLEGRGVLAHYDRRLDELVVWSSTQFPHVIRSMLCASLGLSERKVRVVAPDVGGGFGVKNNFNPEEIAIAALALKLGRPVRWVEDRREHLLASPHAREHEYELTAYAQSDGRILGVEATVTVDAGAYSVWPWTSHMEAAMACGIMTGPYDIAVFHGTARRRS